MPLEVALGAVVLALLHLVGARLAFIAYVPRSGWLSFAGGVSVAYVFVHLLPELAEAEEVLGNGLTYVGDRLGWLFAVAGLALFYGVEVVSRRSSGDRQVGAFWFAMGSYAAYNFLIAYLLHQQAEAGSIELTLFVSAMALHFLVNDFALREHHQDVYRRVGRWVLVAAIAVGAWMGVIVELEESLVAGATAFIGGGIVLNVLKEELPGEAESRFGAFAVGLVAYSALLIFL